MLGSTGHSAGMHHVTKCECDAGCCNMRCLLDVALLLDCACASAQCVVLQCPVIVYALYPFMMCWLN